jgi:hypothetical protein
MNGPTSPITKIANRDRNSEVHLYFLEITTVLRLPQIGRRGEMR